MTIETIELNYLDILAVDVVEAFRAYSGQVINYMYLLYNGIADTKFQNGR